MSRKLDKPLEQLESKEKGEAEVLRRAEAGRKLREAPDYVARDAKNKVEVSPMPERIKGDKGLDSQEVERELEHRQEEAEKVWQDCGECRSEFAREFGVDTHRRMEEEIRKEELAKGRKEGPETFEIERTVVDPEGREHRPDFWDHEAKAIDDIKPVHRGETVGELVEKHDDQLLRYVRAAKETRGEEIKEVGIRPYPGTDGKDADG